MGSVMTVEEVRQPGCELDAWSIVRQLKDEHRWHEQCSKGEASARVAQRLREGDAQRMRWCGC